MIQASAFAHQTDTIMIALIAVCGTVFFLVLAAIFYLSYRYKAGKKINRSNPPLTNVKLELGWTVPTLIIFLFFFIWGAKNFTASHAEADADYEVHVIAKQWMWKFEHPDGRRELNELHIPLNKKIKLTMISEDVIHSLFIPDFRMKQDILPERFTTLMIHPVVEGNFPVLCTQYCGMSHSKMLADVFVMKDGDFKKWQHTVGTRILTANARKNGEALIASKGCTSCHSVTEASEEGMTGPSLWGLYKKKVILADGKSILADDNYIHESVYKPNSKIVKGFSALMPTFEGQVSEEEFQSILTYIKSLKAKNE